MSLSFHRLPMQALQDACGLFQKAVADMQYRGLRQWEWGKYPNAEILEEDIRNGALYGMEQEGRLVGAVALCPQQEPQYEALAWHFGVKPLTLHRLALDPEAVGRGLAGEAMAFAKEEGLRLGFDSLRLDTSSRNHRALKLFRAATLREAGVVHFDDPTIDYPCFEVPLSESCPILPIRMHPAYRYGDMTPWGGEGLRNAFGLDIPDKRTGEALVISAIPGLESTDDTGVKLTQLMARYGEGLLGRDRDFPLLLKLIAAEDKLSVQVHPGDAYAKAHEGKLGKSEAWVILRAEPGAQIAYGMKPGTQAQALRRAALAGEDIQPMIAQVPVKAGDVFYMPSGMVHAIGGGIVLYEIQQSSDVTYRLWDYRRKDAKGQERELHLKQAMDVIDLTLAGERTRLPEARGLHRLLSVPAFTLDCAVVDGQWPLEAHPQSLRMVTALGDMRLCWPGAELALRAGQSALLPVSCPALTMVGEGKALIAAVR